MAITSFPTFAVPNFGEIQPTGSNWSLSYVTLNATSDKVAFIFRVPKTGTLDKFEFLTDTVTNNPDNGLRLSFQTVDATTGLPDGTQDEYRDITGTISSDTWQVPGLMTSDGTDGGAKRSVTKGDWLACVVEFVSFVASDSIRISALNTASSLGYDPGTFVGDASTGTYVKSFTLRPNLALKYNDGSYGELAFPFGPYQSVGTRTFSSSSTPDEYALRFQLPVQVQSTGAWARLGTNGDADIVLYDSGGSALRTTSIDKDMGRASGVGWMVPWTSDITLSANTTYYLSVKPTTTTTVTLQYVEFPSSTYLPCVPGGAEWYEASKTDGGSFSTDDTYRPMLGLLINGIEVSTGGGGGGSFTFVG